MKPPGASSASSAKVLERFRGDALERVGGIRRVAHARLEVASEIVFFDTAEPQRQKKFYSHGYGTVK